MSAFILSLETFRHGLETFLTERYGRTVPVYCEAPPQPAAVTASLDGRVVISCLHLYESTHLRRQPGFARPDLNTNAVLTPLPLLDIGIAAVHPNHATAWALLEACLHMVTMNPVMNVVAPETNEPAWRIRVTHANPSFLEHTQLVRHYYPGGTPVMLVKLENIPGES